MIAVTQMARRARRCGVLALAIGAAAVSTRAGADPELIAGSPATPPLRRVGLGLELGFPFGYRAPPPVALSARVRLTPDDALVLAAGAPTPSLGLGLAVGYDRQVPLTFVHPAWAVYFGAGAQIGFLGPAYYARHYNALVGYDYIFEGPVAAVVRLPVGLRVQWGRVETFAEGHVSWLVTPKREALPGVDLGARVYF